MNPSKTAIIVVDLQSDFTEWKNGSLAVAGSDAAYIDSVTQAVASLRKAGYSLFATQDWHPPGHMSFASTHPGSKVFDSLEIKGRVQVLWPDHCVQGSQGAKILLDQGSFEAVVQKGKDPRHDSYSGFQDDGGEKTVLEGLLRARGVESLVVFGLATDYCVQATALDGRKAGFQVTVVEDLSLGVAADTTSAALKNLEKNGVKLVKTLDL